MRGSGVSNGREAVEARNARMLELIEQYLPDGQLRILELGCGRGGLTRFIASELKRKDRLAMMVGLNISSRENDYNMGEAAKAGLSATEFRVDTRSFDDLTCYDSGAFDLVMVNDSLVYTRDYAKLMSEVSRMLAPARYFIYSDLLRSEAATKEQLGEVYKRLGIVNLSTARFNDDSLTGAGMTCHYSDVSADGIIKHYGFMRRCAGET